MRAMIDTHGISFSFDVKLVLVFMAKSVQFKQARIRELSGCLFVKQRKSIVFYCVIFDNYLVKYKKNRKIKERLNHCHKTRSKIDDFIHQMAS